MNQTTSLWDISDLEYQHPNSLLTRSILHGYNINYLEIDEERKTVLIKKYPSEISYPLPSNVMANKLWDWGLNQLIPILTDSHMNRDRISECITTLPTDERIKVFSLDMGMEHFGFILTAHTKDSEIFEFKGKLIDLEMNGHYAKVVGPFYLISDTLLERRKKLISKEKENFKHFTLRYNIHLEDIVQVMALNEDHAQNIILDDLETFVKKTLRRALKNPVAYMSSNMYPFYPQVISGEKTVINGLKASEVAS